MTEASEAAARTVHELRRFARDVPTVPILVQRDPDPDGMASALGIRRLLHRSADESPIISLGMVTRPENLRMAELLDVRVTQVTDAELRGFVRVVAVDTQPDSASTRTRYAVIDHHPPRAGYTADLVDIRPEIGAVATMVTDYLRHAGERIPARLATALLYGIRTDTDVLRRGTSARDVEAYAYLQERADPELLRKISRAAFPADAMRSVGQALAGLQTRGDIAVAFAGRLDDRTAHMLPNLADLCLGVEGVSWAAAAGLVGDELVINIRRTGGGLGAGELARALSEAEGQGGGHQAMGRVATHLDAAAALSDRAGDEASAASILARVEQAIEGLRAVR